MVSDIVDTSMYFLLELFCSKCLLEFFWLVIIYLSNGNDYFILPCAQCRSEFCFKLYVCIYPEKINTYLIIIVEFNQILYLWYFSVAMYRVNFLETVLLSLVFFYIFLMREIM